MTIRLILRERLGFEGPVLFDCSTLPLESMECLIHAPLRALLGECDMVRLSGDLNLQIASIRAIYAAAGSADLSESATAAAETRVSNLKDQYASWDTALAEPRDLSAMLSANSTLAQATYRASITLLSTGPTPLRNLPPTAVLVLLSPTVPSQAIPANPADAAASDPFEPLGRALSHSHSRIRHVPYTVSAGLTGTHMAFLNRASVVVLVLCNASSALTEAQEEFTTAVRIAVRERELVPGAEAIRKIVVGAGDPRDLRGDWGGWWALCCYEYTRGALEAAAGVITGNSVATGVLPVQLRYDWVIQRWPSWKQSWLFSCWCVAPSALFYWYMTLQMRCPIERLLFRWLKSLINASCYQCDSYRPTDVVRRLRYWYSFLSTSLSMRTI